MWLLAPCRQQAKENRRGKKGGRGMQSLVSVSNPQQQWYRNRQSLAKTRHACRPVCSTLFLSGLQVWWRACNAQFKRHPASSHKAWSIAFIWRNWPTNSSNWVLILLNSTNCLNFAEHLLSLCPNPQIKAQEKNKFWQACLIQEGFRPCLLVLWEKPASSSVCVPQQVSTFKSSSNRGGGSDGKTTQQNPLGFVIQEIKFHILLLYGLLHLQIIKQKPLVHHPWFYKGANAQDLRRQGYIFKMPGLVAVLGRKYQFPDHQPSALAQTHIAKGSLEASAVKILWIWWSSMGNSTWLSLLVGQEFIIFETIALCFHLNVFICPHLEETMQVVKTLPKPELPCCWVNPLHTVLAQ